MRASVMLPPMRALEVDAVLALEVRRRRERVARVPLDRPRRQQRSARSGATPYAPDVRWRATAPASATRSGAAPSWTASRFSCRTSSSDSSRAMERLSPTAT